MRCVQELMEEAVRYVLGLIFEVLQTVFMLGAEESFADLLVPVFGFLMQAFELFADTGTCTRYIFCMVAAC